MKKLNIEKLNSRIDKIITSEEALSEIVPIEWTKDVLNGNKKIYVTEIDRDTRSTCLKRRLKNGHFRRKETEIY